MKRLIVLRKMKFIYVQDPPIIMRFGVGLMSTRAMKLGAAGAVVNGYSRDTNEIEDLDFPTFSIGSYASRSGP